MEPIIANVLHSGEPVLEGWQNGIWYRTRIFGAEIEITPVPLGINIHNVVELRVLERGFNILGFQNCLDECFDCLCHLYLGEFWYFKIR